MKEMTSRERILAALRLEEPDRVPFMDTIAPAIQEAVMEKKDFTIVDVARRLHMDTICFDLFPPVFAEIHHMNGLNIVGEGLIKKDEDLKLMDGLADPNDQSLYEPIKRFIDDYAQSDLAICGRIRTGASSTLLSLGMTTFSYALYDNPKLIERVFDKYAEWAITVIGHLNTIGADFYWVCDDLAFKTGPMFSPDVFREIFLPRMKRVVSHIKLPWVYHSDGNLALLLDDLLTLGMNGLHPIEPGAMDIVEVKQKYGKKVCLVGNIDLAYTLTRGTVEDVHAEVKQRIREIGPGGGYILASANSIPPYVKPENLIAMGETCQKYGKYPIVV